MTDNMSGLNKHTMTSLETWTVMINLTQSTNALAPGFNDVNNSSDVHWPGDAWCLGGDGE